VVLDETMPKDEWHAIGADDKLEVWAGGRGGGKTVTMQSVMGSIDEAYNKDHGKIGHIPYTGAKYERAIKGKKGKRARKKDHGPDVV